MLFHHRKNGVCYSYPVSTAKKGIGNQNGSLQTPLGQHRIANKIGDGEPIFTAFKSRLPMHIYDPKKDDPDSDWILTRILWLTGRETGKNKRGAVDSHARYIYIHGTHAEDQIGLPASHGCIRMCNADVMELFDHVALGENVCISK